MQDIFNLLPNLSVSELIKAFAGMGEKKSIVESANSLMLFWHLLSDIVLICAVKTNDMMLVIYLSSLIRSVIALHNLINNKVRSFHPVLNREKEKGEISHDALCFFQVCLVCSMFLVWKYT